MIFDQINFEVDTEVDTLSCTSNSSDLVDDLSDGIPFGPYPSPLFYDEENTKSATDTDGGEYQFKFQACDIIMNSKLIS